MSSDPIARLMSNKTYLRPTKKRQMGNFITLIRKPTEGNL